MASSAIPSSTNCSSQTSAASSTLSCPSQEQQPCYFSDDDEIEGTTCAISLEKMKHPVMLECGHSFEEEALRTALKTSQFCPTCRTPATGIVRNYNLASSIEAMSKHSSGKTDIPTLARNIAFPNTIKSEEGNTPDKTFAQHLRGILHHHPDTQIAIANEICCLIDEDPSRMPAIDVQPNRVILTYTYKEDNEEAAEKEVVVKVCGRAAWVLKNIVDRVELTLLARTPGFAERLARFIVNPSKFAEESRSTILNKGLQAALFSISEETTAIQEITTEILKLVGQDLTRLPLITVSRNKKQAALEVEEKGIKIEVVDQAAIALKQIKMAIQQIIKQKEQSSSIEQTLKSFTESNEKFQTEMLKTMRQMQQESSTRIDRLEQQSAPVPFSWKRAVVPLIPLAAGVIGRYAGCVVSQSDPNGSCSTTLLPTISDLPSLGLGAAGIANLVYNGVDPSFTSYLSIGAMTATASYTQTTGEATQREETSRQNERISTLNEQHSKTQSELNALRNKALDEIDKLQKQQSSTLEEIKQLKTAKQPKEASEGCSIM